MLCLTLLHLVESLICLPWHSPGASSVALLDPVALVLVHCLGLVLPSNNLRVVLPSE